VKRAGSASLARRACAPSRPTRDTAAHKRPRLTCGSGEEDVLALSALLEHLQLLLRTEWVVLPHRRRRYHSLASNRHADVGRTGRLLPRRLSKASLARPVARHSRRCDLEAEGAEMGFGEAAVLSLDLVMAASECLGEGSFLLGVQLWVEGDGGRASASCSCRGAGRSDRERRAHFRLRRSFQLGDLLLGPPHWRATRSCSRLTSRRLLDRRRLGLDG